MEGPESILPCPEPSGIGGHYSVAYPLHPVDGRVKEEGDAESEATAEEGSQGGLWTSDALGAGEGGEVRPLASELDICIYENGEMRIGWDLPNTYNGYGMVRGWYHGHADSTGGLDATTSNRGWTSYASTVKKVTVANTVKVENASQLFQGMSKVTSMSLSNFDMSSCTSTESMFYGCSNLKTLNISGWQMGSMSASNMYEGCTSLATVKVGSGVYWSTRLPEYSVNGHTDWYSSAAKQWLTSSEIYYGRDRTADTYSKSVPAKRDISKSTCKASIKTQAWTGKQIKPALTVKWGSATLKKGTHYKVVKYGSNKNNGTSGNWVKIQGIGSYKGTRTVRFRIRKPNVLYRVHRQTYGWETSWRRNGQKSGTTGQSKRLEGIYVKLSNKPVTGTIQYRTHIQKIGWEKSWKSAGKMSGTSGRALRLEAIQIRLTGNMAKKYNVWYRVHAQHFGWMGWTNNGAKAGTAGYSYRLESIQIVLKPKGTSAPAANFMGARRTTSAAFKDRNAKSLKYKFKRDTWSFENFVTYIPKEYYQRMYGTSLGSMMYYDQNYGYAPGVCYGFSTSVGSMIKHGYPKVSSFGASKIFSISKYDRSSTLKMTAESFIQYCYLTQYDYRLLNEMYRNKNNYSGLVSAVRKHQYGGTAIEIDLMGNGGHSVFPIKISANNSSKTVIDIYDNNHPNTLQKLTLYKSGGKYTGFNYSDGSYTWIAWETPASRVKSFMAGNAVYNLDLVVRSDAEGANMNLISTDTDLTVISGGKTYTLSPNNTSDLDMVVPVLTKGGSTKKNLYWVGFDTSDMVVKSLNKDATFSVTTKTGGVEVSAKKGSTLSLSVSDSAKNSVSIDGKKGDAFQVTYREDNGSNDLDEYKVKGTAAGSLVETKLNDSGKVDVKGGTLK